MRSLDEIARRAQDGDDEALEQLIHTVQGDVRRFAAYLVRTAESDDLAQETLVRVVEHLDRWQRGPVRAWILGVTRNVCREHLGRHARHRTEPTATPLHGADPDMTATTEVMVLLQSLPTEQGEAILLTQLVGLSYLEAAEVAGCAVGTIRSRVARGRTSLARELGTLRREGHG